MFHSHKVPSRRTYQTSSLGLPLTLLTALRGTSVSTLVVLVFIPLRLHTRREGEDCAATSVHATGLAWLLLCAWRFVSVSATWVSRWPFIAIQPRRHNDDATASWRTCLRQGVRQYCPPDANDPPRNRGGNFWNCLCAFHSPSANAVLCSTLHLWFQAVTSQCSKQSAPRPLSSSRCSQRRARSSLQQRGRR